MDLCVRPFRADDQRAVSALIIDGLRERWGAAFEDGHNPDLDDIHAHYVELGSTVLVGMIDGELVATGTLVPSGHGRAAIVRVSVDRRLRREGLARSIVEALLAAARDTGVTTVEVETDTPWHSAVGLYRSCGFTETKADEVSTYFELDL